MKKEEYLNIVINHISNKPERARIKEELENHINDRKTQYTDIGYDEETALQRAIDAMGDADKVGEELDRLHSSKLSIILWALFFVMYISGLIYVHFNRSEFKIIELFSDAALVTHRGCIISIAVFALSALCTVCALRTKNRIVLSVWGISSIMSVFAYYAFFPFGYTIIGLFTDFPASLKNPEEYSDFFDGLAGNAFSLGHSAESVTIIFVLVVLFYLYMYITGIISLAYSKELASQIKGRYDERLSARCRNYGTYLIVLTIIGIAAFSIEYGAYCKGLQEEKALLSRNEYEDIIEVENAMKDIKLPMSINSRESGEETWNMTIVNNPHLCMALWPNDDETLYDTLCISSNKEPDITKKDIQEITMDMTSSEVLDKIPLTEIDTYCYQVEGRNIYESIYLREKDHSFSCRMEFENGKMIVKENKNYLG